MELRVFTMNVWGIPYISKDKAFRIEAIGEALKSKDYDVICLQEIWDTGDYESIYSKIKSKVPYRYYYYSGFLGSGLCTFSKWPIVETFFYKFPLNGYVHKIQHGDWFAGKGVALAKISVNGEIIQVFNSHLHAQYCEKNDEYLSHRLSQSYEAGQLVRLGSEGAKLTLFLGDFNSKPTDICTEILRAIPGLQDAFIHHDKELEYGTNETTRNSYAPAEALKKNPHGGRLDYILFKSNSQHEAQSTKYDFAFPDRIPNSEISYSDHEAIEATIQVKIHKSTKPPQHPEEDVKQIVHRALSICENGLREVDDKVRTLKILILGVLVCLGISVIAQIDKDHHFSSFFWFLIYFPQFLVLFLLGLYYFISRIEFQSLRGFLESLNVLST